ncbi:MAG: MMPL family transporter [Clostridia bacterium]|nr:MMPL family transporter [Clostridia bacterium]
MKQKLARFIVHTRVLWMALLLCLSVLAAFSMSKTRVNYDLTSYLAEDTETKRGLNLMNGEFEPVSAMSVVLADVSREEAEAHAARMAAMEGVITATHDPEEGFREQDGHSYRLIAVNTVTARDEEVLDAVEEQLADVAHMISGGAKDNRYLRESIIREMPTVMVVSCAIVFVILLVMTGSYLEPFIFFAVIAVSILLNMGSNWIFDSISFITFAVTAILQLALAMDYSIMLMNSFDRLLAQEMAPREAMAQALCDAFMPIASSALTTVAGMLALVFMSFTIGYDIGVVLAKGIILSMLTVFLLMPGLLTLTAPLLRKTRHKTLRVSGRGVARLADALHGALPVSLIALILVSALLQVQNVYTYTVRDIGEEARMISGLFGQSNQLVVLYPRDDSDEGVARQQELAERVSALTLDGAPLVRKVVSMVTTGKAAVTYYDAASAAELTGYSEAAIQSIVNVMGIETPIRGDVLLDKLANLSRAISFLMPKGAQEQLEQAREMLKAANMVFNGPHYSRALLSLDLSLAGDHNHEAIEAIRGILQDVYGEDTAMAGTLLAMDDIAISFSGDLRRVSLITVIFVFLIVLLSFRSLAVPTLLVCVIQGAIWINMCFSNWYDGSIFFMCYLICMGLQMGATIDYGILLTNHYRAMRASLPPREAAAQAVGLSVQTILTSGLVLVVAGFTVGIVSTVYYISSIGTMLGRGALISVALVLLLLPKLLQWLDRWIVKSADKRRNRID